MRRYHPLALSTQSARLDRSHPWLLLRPLRPCQPSATCKAPSDVTIRYSSGTNAWGVRCRSGAPTNFAWFLGVPFGTFVAARDVGFWREQVSGGSTPRIAGFSVLTNASALTVYPCSRAGPSLPCHKFRARRKCRQPLSFRGIAGSVSALSSRPCVPPNRPLPPSATPQPNATVAG